ncbi:MAG: 50S ribosomal protein L4 [Deltaproteobacteria bacterium]|nr:50S ribosomal protein L4 [Deltaproteobacteria bacterium]
MAKFDVVNFDGKKVSEIELSDAIFARDVNQHLIYEVAKFQQINRRAGTQAVKNRSLVSGGGKKPWKQKGTGRARQGSIRASHWVGGGKAMGPTPRDYTYRPPRAVRRGGIASAISLRAKDKKLVILDAFGLKNGKTKEAAGVFKKLGLKNALVVEAADNTGAHRAVRNMARFDVIAPKGINLESILRHEHLVLTVGAAKELEGALV